MTKASMLKQGPCELSTCGLRIELGVKYRWILSLRSLESNWDPAADSLE